MPMTPEGVCYPESIASLGALSDAAFRRQASELTTALLACKDADLDTAADIHVRLLPFEFERVRRAAVDMLRGDDTARLDLLFVTVGGQADTPTLAVMASPARHVVLLHTDAERAGAEAVVARLGLLADQCTLRTIGDGRHSLNTYQVIHDEWERRQPIATVGVDITGGLKVMSAAGAAAAYAMPQARVFYIDSGQHRVRGKTFNHSEHRVVLDNPYEVFGSAKRSLAREFFNAGRFQAAAEMYRELSQTVMHSVADSLAADLALGYEALAQLDMLSAAQRLEALATRLEALVPQCPQETLVSSRHVVRHQAGAIRCMAALLEPAKVGQVGSSLELLRSDDCVHLVALLVAAARRRQAHKEWDVAALLAYRATEFVCQRRIAVRLGVDPGNIDWARVRAASGLTDAELFQRLGLDPERQELPLRLDRSTGYDLLSGLGPEPEVVDVVERGKFVGLGEARNKSLLAHGFKSLGGSVTATLVALAELMFERMLTCEGRTREESELLGVAHELVLL